MTKHINECHSFGEFKMSCTARQQKVLDLLYANHLANTGPYIFVDTRTKPPLCAGPRPQANPATLRGLERRGAIHYWPCRDWGAVITEKDRLFFFMGRLAKMQRKANQLAMQLENDYV